MLAAAVVAYLAVSVPTGLYAARRVHGSADFAAAGRRLSLPMVTATVFATWYGAELVAGLFGDAGARVQRAQRPDVLQPSFVLQNVHSLRPVWPPA